MGWEVVLDTVFELRLLLDSSPVAISRMHNRQLLFIYLDCCCHEHSNLIKEVVEGGRPRHARSCGSIHVSGVGTQLNRAKPCPACTGVEAASTP